MTVTVNARRWMERGYVHTNDMPEAEFTKWMDENPAAVFQQAKDWISNVGEIVKANPKSSMIEFEPYDENYTDELAE